MNQADGTSIATLVAVAALGFFAARTAMLRVRSRSFSWAFVAALWLASFAGLWFVDVGIPWRTSHYRPGGEPAPVWLAVGVLFLRFGALGAVVGLISRRGRAQSGET